MKWPRISLVSIGRDENRQVIFGRSRVSALLLIIILRARLKLGTALMLEGQEAGSRRTAVHANAPIHSEWTCEGSEVPAAATAVPTLFTLGERHRDEASSTSRFAGQQWCFEPPYRAQEYDSIGHSLFDGEFQTWAVEKKPVLVQNVPPYQHVRASWQEHRKYISVDDS